MTTGTYARKSRAALRASIEKCLATGEEQILRDDGVFVYIIKPQFPLIESAMKEKMNENLAETYPFRVFSQIRTLGVRTEEEDMPELCNFLWTEHSGRSIARIEPSQRLTQRFTKPLANEKEK